MAATTNNGKKQVQVDAGSQTLNFHVGLTEFNAFQNDFLPNNKVAPCVNFLNVCVDKDHKDTVNDLCDQGLAVDLAQMVAAEFKPDIQLRVKK